MKRKLPIRVFAILAAAAMSLAACGGEDATTDTETTPGDDAKLAKACEANVGINKGFNVVFADIPEPEGPPSPEVAEQIQTGMDREVIPHVDAIEKNAPDAIADELKIAVKAVREFRKDPATNPFEEGGEAIEAVEEIDEYFFENCDLKKATIQAREYEFGNIPEISTGDLSVQLENDGKELHEFVVLAKKAGVTESFDDILNLPEEEGRKKVDFIGEAHARPGESDYSVFSFEKPGDYLAVCFVSQGTTGEEEEGEGSGPAATGSPTAAGSPAGTASPAATGSPTAAGSPSPGGDEEEGGPPHFTLGMKKEFKVS